MPLPLDILSRILMGSQSMGGMGTPGINPNAADPRQNIPGAQQSAQSNPSIWQRLGQPQVLSPIIQALGLAFGGPNSGYFAQGMQQAQERERQAGLEQRKMALQEEEIKESKAEREALRKERETRAAESRIRAALNDIDPMLKNFKGGEDEAAVMASESAKLNRLTPEEEKRFLTIVKTRVRSMPKEEEYYLTTEGEYPGLPIKGQPKASGTYAGPYDDTILPRAQQAIIGGKKEKPNLLEDIQRRRAELTVMDQERQAMKLPPLTPKEKDAYLRTGKWPEAEIGKGKGMKPHGSPIQTEKGLVQMFYDETGAVSFEPVPDTGPKVDKPTRDSMESASGAAVAEEFAEKADAYVKGITKEGLIAMNMGLNIPLKLQMIELRELYTKLITGAAASGIQTAGYQEMLGDSFWNSVVGSPESVKASVRRMKTLADKVKKKMSVGREGGSSGVTDLGDITDELKKPN